MVTTIDGVYGSSEPFSEVAMSLVQMYVRQVEVYYVVQQVSNLNSAVLFRLSRPNVRDQAASASVNMSAVAICKVLSGGIHSPG